MGDKTATGAATDTTGSDNNTDKVNIRYSDGSERNYVKRGGMTVTQDKNKDSKETGHTTIHPNGNVHKHGDHE